MTRTLVFNGIPYTFTLRSAAQEGGTNQILIDAYRHLHGYGPQEFS